MKLQRGVKAAGAALILLTAGSFGGASASSGIDRLDRFFAEEFSMFAEFVQIVFDEGFNVVEESSGLVWLERPDLFRWEYFVPYEQVIVSDGKQTWIYDAELEQVTVSDSESVVGSTPAEILAGAGAIEDSYDIQDLGGQGEYLWVSFTPKNEEDSRFELMRMAFGDDHLELVEVVDAVGNTMRIQMLGVVKNPELEDDIFQFAVPEGVDVVRAQ